MLQTLDTTNWVSYPFSVSGVNFISQLDPTGDMYPRVMNVGVEVFIGMNQDAIGELVGNPNEMTTEDLQAKLDFVNEGATQAIIRLA
jgi:hypothetical protein